MSEPAPQPRAGSDPNWSQRLKVWGVVTAAVLLALIVGAAFIPRWWAQRVGDQANESFTGGITLGLFYGFIFTVLPLLLIVWGIRRRRSGRMWVWILVGAALLALPNLFTLGITVGPGSGAHAGDRTLDVEAPGFRGASLAGALLAAGAIAFIWYLLSSRRRARAELHEREQPPAS